jgi:hypothetical protein
MTRQRNLWARLESEGTNNAEADARRVRAPSGLDMMPRGQALVDHVTAGMAAGMSADQIAKAVGYRVDRCAIRLAEAHAAPLGRALMGRHWNDQRAIEREHARTEAEAAHEAALDAEWEQWKSVQAAEECARNSATLADDLIELAEFGESWVEAARRCGYKHIASLAQRLQRNGDLERVKEAFGAFRCGGRHDQP